MHEQKLAKRVLGGNWGEDRVQTANSQSSDRRSLNSGKTLEEF